jgi:PAB-dependent poly(A)-specific ribonuclease subunit 3
MEELADSLGKLSTDAKEWKPGQSYQPPAPSRSTLTPLTSSSTTRSKSYDSSSVWGNTSISTNGNGIGSQTSTSSLSASTSPWKSIPKRSTSASSFNANASDWKPSNTKEFIPQSAAGDSVADVQDQPVQTSTMPRGSTPSSKNQTFTTNTPTPLSQPQQKTIYSLGLPNHTLWNLYRSIAMDSTREMEPDDERYKAIPPSFTNALPLEQDDMNIGNNATRSSFGYHSSIFKVVNQEDGRYYCLRRFDNIKGVNQKIAMTVTNAWVRAVSRSRNANSAQRHVLNHPGLVRLFKCFYVVQNRAVFFVHQYHPMSLTLREVLYGLGRGMGGMLDAEARANQGFHPLEEGTIWSYVTQLVSAIRAIHRGNLACRTLQLNHILVSPEAGSGIDENAQNMMKGDVLRTNRVRLRINCIGIVDTLEFEARRPIGELQVEDMRSLGRIILSLASGTEIGSDANAETLDRCDVFMRQHFSQELHTLTMALLARPRPGRMGMMIVNPPTIDEICRAVTEHAFDEMDSANAIVDGMDDALSMEYESGRALRLMMKFAFINERPEFGVDTRWSESGDCYVLKLFRDFGKTKCISIHVIVGNIFRFKFQLAPFLSSPKF